MTVKKEEYEFSALDDELLASYYLSFHDLMTQAEEATASDIAADAVNKVLGGGLATNVTYTGSSNAAFWVDNFEILPEE